MSGYIHKSRNVTVLLYHLVFPAKYRRAVIDPEVDQTLRSVCLDIEARYEIKFLEIGTDKDHVHFLVQSVPMYSVKKIVQVIKSTEVYRRHFFSVTPLRCHADGTTASVSVIYAAWAGIGGDGPPE